MRCIQVGVDFDAGLLSFVFQQFFEWIFVFLVFRLQIKHDVAVHLHETAIAVPRKAFVPRLLGQGLHRLVIQANVEDGIHHPGHRISSSRAARHQQGVRRRPELGPHDLLDTRQQLQHLVLQLRRILAVVGIIIVTDLGRDREPRGNRQTDVRHLGQIGTFASQQRPQLGLAIGLTLAKEIHVLRCRICHTGSLRPLLREITSAGRLNRVDSTRLSCLDFQTQAVAVKYIMSICQIAARTTEPSANSSAVRKLTAPSETVKGPPEGLTGVERPLFEGTPRRRRVARPRAQHRPDRGATRSRARRIQL